MASALPRGEEGHCFVVDSDGELVGWNVSADDLRVPDVALAILKNHLGVKETTNLLADG